MAAWCKKRDTSISSNIKCCSLKRIKYVRIESGFGWVALYYNVLIETFSLSPFVNIDVLSNHVNFLVYIKTSLKQVFLTQQWIDI